MLSAALSLVWNMLLAPRFHGETITRQNLVATFIICVGVTSSVIFSSHGTPTYLLADLLLLYQKTAMYGYIFCGKSFHSRWCQCGCDMKHSVFSQRMLSRFASVVRFTSAVSSDEQLICI